MDESQRKLLYDTPSNIVFSRKLETALRASTVHNFHNRVKHQRLTNDDKLITRGRLYAQGCSREVTTLGFTDILSGILAHTNEGKIYDQRSQLNRDEVMTKALTKTVLTQVDLLFSKNDLPVSQEMTAKVRSFLRKAENTLLIRNILAVLRALENVISNSHRINCPKIRNLPAEDKLVQQLRINHFKDPHGLFECEWSSKLLILSVNGVCHVYPKSYLLLIHNKLADLASVLMLARASAGASLPKNCTDVILRFVDEMISLHYQYDSGFFSIAKSLEALCIAESLIDLDDWVNDEFLDSIAQDLRVDLGFHYKSSQLRRIIRRADTPMRHELCCLSKIFGHPLVDMTAGAASLHKTTNEVHHIDPLKVVESINYIKENYIRNFILKNGHWPPAHITSVNCCPALKEAWVAGVDPGSVAIRKKYGPVSIEDYVHVEILPSMKFEYLQNAIRYLKDKTISVLRDPVVSYYLSPSDKAKNPTWKETRLLLFFLTHDQASIDHTAFIKKFALGNDIEELMDYLVIRIVPKEKELKEIFRGFGCLTYENRLRCLAQEKNVMHYLDLYCDEQAMTLSELELLKKLYALRTIAKAYPKHKPIYISVDASKWNNHFRSATVDRAMAPTLDKIFDIPIFSKTHWAYENTLFYVPDEEESYFWEGQSGGIEGLNQDTWVVTYLAQIKSAMRNFNFHYQAFCKGDDFRVVVLVPPHVLEVTPIEDIKTSVVTEISRVATLYGHKVKILESYGSSTYFSFSKAASYKTIEFPQGFRKIQKCYGANNAFIPTLDEYVGSAFSNAHSACKVQTHVLPSYIVALKWAMIAIVNNETYKDISHNQLSALLLTPSIVGGFPIIYLHNMFVRAESDLLPPYLHILWEVKDKDIMLYRYMKNFLRIPRREPKDIVSLCKDPYSIPCDRPNLPTTILRQSLLTHLKPMIQNEEVQALIAASESKYTTQVLECLKSCNVYNPKVFSHIYASTPKGQVEELIRKFESSRSVHEILILRAGRRRADKILRFVIRAEFALQRWRRGRLDGTNLGTTSSVEHLVLECPAESANRIREHAWGKPVESITNPPLSHSIRITNGVYTTNMPWDSQNAFLLQKSPIVEYIPGSEENEHWGTSNKEPFIGRSTSSGLIHPTVHIVDKDPLLVKLKTLIELVSWTNCRGLSRDGHEITSNMPALIRNIITTFTGYNLEDLQKFGGTHVHGTISHHLGAPKFRSSIVPNTLSNIYQQFEGDSSYHVRIAREPGHYFVNYLYVYCYGVCMQTFDLNFGQTSESPSTIWLVTDLCPYCTQTIEETPLLMDLSPLDGVQAPKLLNTKVIQSALEVLHHAVEDYSKEDFREVLMTDNIRIEEASLGVLQELTDMASRDRRRLETRYTGHNLTAEGEKVLRSLQPRGMSTGITEQEYTYIKADYILEALISIIYYSLQRLFTDVDINNVTEKMCILPVEQLPWYTLVQKIHIQNKLRDVIMKTEILRKRPAGIAYVNDAYATLYLGEACYYIAIKRPLIPVCIYLTYYKASTLKHHLMRTLYVGLQMWLLSRFGRVLTDFDQQILRTPELLAPVRANLDRRIMILMMMFMMGPTTDDLLDSIIEDIETNGRITIPLINLAELDYDTFVEHGGWETESGFTHFMRNYPHIAVPDRHMVTEEEFEELLQSAKDESAGFTVHVVSTTLPVCLEALRSVHNVNDEQLDHVIREERIDQDLMIELPLPTLRVSPIRVCLLPSSLCREPIEVPPIQDCEVYDSKIIMDYSLLYRPFGHATLAMTKIAEIWARLNMPPALRNPMSITIFGDGLGGTSAFMCMVAPGSYIKIVTLPERLSQRCVPGITEIFAQRYGCIIDDDSIRTGMSDVSEEYNMLLLESDPRLYDIIISDIEYKTPNTDMTWRIMRHITMFYLRRRNHRSVFICQVRLDEMNVIYKMAKLLSPHCGSCAVIKLKSSTRHEQAYLVAWGWTMPFTHEYSYEHQGESVRIYDALNKYRNRYDRRYKELSDHTTFTINPTSADWFMFRNYMGILPWRIELIMWKRLNTTINVNVIISLLRRYPNLDAHITSYILPQVVDQIGALRKFFETSKHEGINVETIDLSTRTHCLKMYQRYLVLVAYTECIRFFDGRINKEVSDLDIRRAYAAEVALGPRRLQIPPISGAHFRKGLKAGNFELDLYHHYHLGWCTGIEYVAWLLNMKRFAP